MQAFFLAGAIQSLFLSLFILTKRRKKTSDYILVIWLTFVSIPLILYYYNYEEFSLIIATAKHVPTWLMIINVPFLLGQSPLLFIYLSIHVSKNDSFKIRYLLHFIPFALFLFLSNVIIRFSTADRLNFNIFEYDYYIVLMLFFPFILVMGGYYTIISFNLIKKYSIKIKEQFSYTEDIDLNWMKILTIIITAAWLVLILTTLFLKFQNDLAIVHDLSFLTITFAIFVIAYFGLKQTNVFVDLNRQNKVKIDNKPESKLIEPDAETKKLISDIILFMENKKPFLNNTLSIKQLADNLDIMPYQLSKIINDYLNQNFFDFVNKYRVEEVKKQMSVNSKYTLLGIAYECGFNSKSSFNRIFKKYTGLTPSQYQKNILQKAA